MRIRLSILLSAAVLSLAASLPQERLAERVRMVQQQIEARGIDSSRVLAAMRAVPRHHFVPQEHQALAYADTPLPIGNAQTISQPYIVAWMTQLADIAPGEHVLEIGTGSGYQAAVLGEITDSVWSIEIDCELAARARTTLDRLGYSHVVTRCGDGYKGWPEHAPFQAIIVTAAAPRIPEPLKQQLAVGGLLVIPVGPAGGIQQMRVIERTESGFNERRLDPVRFVPMTGEVEIPPS